ncbi:MAG: hypothetical protein ACKVPX_08585 [Myxococcaceae bacterium]
MGLGTPGLWASGGGNDGFSKACRKALAACGINPDAFGNYNQRLAAGHKARTEYREHMGKKKKDHPAGCKFKEKGKSLGACDCHTRPEAAAYFESKGRPEDFLTANSQSGHSGQNAFSQGAGARADPCTNIPPPPGQQSDGGSFGYDANLAPCTDHFGTSTTKGTTHEKVTRNEEENAKTVKTDKAGRVSEATIANGVDQTAAIVAAGPNPNDHKGGTPDAAQAKQTAKAMSDAQKKQAEVLAKKEGVKPNHKVSASHAKKNQKKARECIQAHWKAGIDKMRMDAIDKHSAVNSTARCKQAIAEENAKRAKQRKKNGTAEPKDIKRFGELPPKAQNAVLKDPSVQKACAAAQKKVEKETKAGSAGAKGKGNKNPSMDDCREFQANSLVTAGWGPGGPGKLPSFSGRRPGGGSTSAASGGGGSAGGAIAPT